MKISAVIGVKDEIDMLPRSVGSLLRSGVETVSIMDDTSSDGTSLAIDALCAALPNVYRIPSTSDLSGGLRMDGPVFGPILARDQSDWLLVGDADEFWIPESGDLRKTHALNNHDLLTVSRFNAALRLGEPSLSWLETNSGLCNLPLIVRQVALSKKIMDCNPEYSWVMHKIAPKVMVRPEKLLRFDVGMHSVIGKEGVTLRKTEAKDVIIAHLPFTTYERFERKIDNARLVFERFEEAHSGTRGWHWKRWIEIQQACGLQQEYNRQFFSDVEFIDSRKCGAVASAAEIFERRKGFVAKIR